MSFKSGEHKNTFILGLASWFGCGKFPMFPGTVGTMGAIPFAYFFMKLPRLYFFFGTIIFILFSILISDKASKILEEDDPKFIVIDEVAGYFVAMLLHAISIINIISGFILFRIFDILKPYPIRLFDQKIKGGKGIVIDDVMAGIYTNLSIYLVNHIYTKFFL